MSTATTKQKKVESFSMERRPRQLKDFLLEDSNSYTISSTGFKSFPRRPLNILQSSSPRSTNSISTDPTVNKKLEHPDSRITPPATTALQRSRSKSQAAADATFSAIHKLLNYAAATISISKSFSDKKKKKQQKRISAAAREWEVSSGAIKVCRVRDILRWKSFRDLVAVEKQQPAEIEIGEEDDECRSLDHISDLNNQTTKASSATTSISSSSGGSMGSSWGGDSEFSFTADELPCLWSSRIDGGVKKRGDDPDGDGERVSVGGEDDEEMKSTDETAACEMGQEPEEKEADVDKEEAEQNSPVSILDDSVFTNEYDENGLSFRQSLANVERTKSKLLQSLEWFESLAAGCDFDLDRYDHQPIDDDDDDEYNNNYFEFDDEDEDVGQDQGTQELNKSKAIGRAHELTHNIKSTSSIDESCERLLFDFFMQELTKTDKSANTDVDYCPKADMAVMEDEAKTYISRRPREHFTRGATTSTIALKGVHVIKDMEREMRWCVNKFDQEEMEDLVVAMEKSVLNVLVDDLLVEFF